jgi:hypothetical protein
MKIFAGFLLFIYLNLLFSCAEKRPMKEYKGSLRVAKDSIKEFSMTIPIDWYQLNKGDIRSYMFVRDKSKERDAASEIFLFGADSVKAGTLSSIENEMHVTNHFKFIAYSSFASSNDSLSEKEKEKFFRKINDSLSKDDIKTVSRVKINGAEGALCHTKMFNEETAKSGNPYSISDFYVLQIKGRMYYLCFKTSEDHYRKVKSVFDTVVYSLEIH